jgi:hypothetical protein
MDDAFENDFSRRRHLQTRAKAFDQLGLAAAQQAGKLVFGQRIGHRRHGTENGGRVAAENDGDRERLPRVGQLKLAKIQRPAAMRQPAHDHLVRAEHLLAVDAEVLPVLVRTFGDDQAPGDQRRHVTRPAMLNRQLRQINVLALPDDFLTRCGRHRFRRHVHDLFQDRQLVPGILEALRRLGFLQIRQQLADFAQGLHRLLAHAECDALGRTEQVGENRDGMSLRFFKKKGRTFRTQHAVADFSHFEAGIDLDADALQFAGLFQLRHEVAQVVIFHRIR